MNRWDQNAKDYFENGIYNIDDRLLAYYGNIVNYKNRKERNLNKEVLIRRLMAMTIVNIEKPCVNKENTSKVFSNGFKLTIDRHNRIIKFIAIKEISKNDNKSYNEKLYDESMNDYILENLKIAYRLVGLNELGTSITNKTNIYNNGDAYNIWRDVYHICEKEYILDAMKAKILLDRVYTGEEYKQPEIEGKGKFARLQYYLDTIRVTLQSNGVASAQEALELTHTIHNICSERRKILNERRKQKGRFVSDNAIYFITTMKNDLGSILM